MRRPQHARHKPMLALQGGVCATHRKGPLLSLAEEERRAGALGLFRSQRRYFLFRLDLFGRGGQHSQLLRHCAHGHWTGVRPFQIRLWWPADGCRSRLEEVASNEKLIRVEEPLDAFVLVVERG